MEARRHSITGYDRKARLVASVLDRVERTFEIIELYPYVQYELYPKISHRVLESKHVTSIEDEVYTVDYDYGEDTSDIEVASMEISVHPKTRARFDLMAEKLEVDFAHAGRVTFLALTFDLGELRYHIPPLDFSDALFASLNKHVVVAAVNSNAPHSEFARHFLNATGNKDMINLAIEKSKEIKKTMVNDTKLASVLYDVVVEGERLFSVGFETYPRASDLEVRNYVVSLRTKGAITSVFFTPDRSGAELLLHAFASEPDLEYLDRALSDLEVAARDAILCLFVSSGLVEVLKKSSW